MEKSRIEKQFDFIKEIDKEKFIIRQTYLSDARKKENECRARMAYGDNDRYAFRICKFGN